MSTNWKAGDKALCVEKFINKDVDSLAPYEDATPVVGTTYLVSHFEVRKSRRLNRDIGGISVVGLDGLWVESRFRKIVPACDRATNQEKGLVPHEGFWEGRQ